MRVAMVVVYDWLKDSRQRHCKCQRILIYGTGDKGVSLVTQLQNSQEYQVVGFLTYGKTLKNHMLADLPVYYFETEESSTCTTARILTPFSSPTSMRLAKSRSA